MPDDRPFVSVEIMDGRWVGITIIPPGSFPLDHDGANRFADVLDQEADKLDQLRVPTSASWEDAIIPICIFGDKVWVVSLNLSQEQLLTVIQAHALAYELWLHADALVPGPGKTGDGPPYLREGLWAEVDEQTGSVLILGDPHPAVEQQRRRALEQRLEELGQAHTKSDARLEELRQAHDKFDARVTGGLRGTPDPKWRTLSVPRVKDMLRKALYATPPQRLPRPGEVVQKLGPVLSTLPEEERPTDGTVRNFFTNKKLAQLVAEIRAE
jgi:hypothetical protein